LPDGRGCALGVLILLGEKYCMSDFEEIEQFLADYRIIAHPERERNFFDIAGFPHYENVFSNVLAFFLEKSDLVLQVLLACIPGYEYQPGEKAIAVSREEFTDKYKRIDIVVTTSKRIIGIENKIGAGLYNDLDDYGVYLEGVADGLPVLKIVLSKNKQSKLPEGWCNIIHQELARQLKIHYYELQRQLKDYRLFLLFNEFVDNIDFLNGGYMDECKEFFQLLQNDDSSGEKIQSILNEVNKAKRFINTFISRIQADTSPVPFSRRWVWNAIDDGEDLFLRAVVFDGFLVGAYNIKLDAYVSPWGLSLAIKASNNQEIDDPEFWETIREIVGNSGNLFSVDHPDDHSPYHWPKNTNYISFEQYDTFRTELIALLGRFDNYAKKTQEEQNRK